MKTRITEESKKRVEKRKSQKRITRSVEDQKRHAKEGMAQHVVAKTEKKNEEKCGRTTEKRKRGLPRMCSEARKA